MQQKPFYWVKRYKMRTFYKNIALLVSTFLLTAVAMIACQSGADDANALKSEVIKVHDRIMPRNAELLQAKADLTGLIAALDSLKQHNPEADTARIRREADSLIAALDAADLAMSEWMHEFRTDYSEMEHEQVMDYLNGEKARIAEVEQAYEESIGGARALMDSLGEQN